jgi:hypothetical protein
MALFETSRQEDERLIQSMRMGNDKAFGIIWQKYFKKLKGFLQGIGSKDNDKNTNYASDALWVFYQGIATYEHSRAEVYTYLCQVAKNKFFKDLRDNKYSFEDIGPNEPEDREGLESFYNDIDNKSFGAFSKDITLELVIDFIRNKDCFNERCLKLYSMDYKKLGLEDFEKTSLTLTMDYLEQEEKIKDETIALEMTRWSDKHENPPKIYSDNLVRVTRKRCKEDLKKSILEAGYVW